ncbi:Ribonuclease H-like superfamily [Sesbania bispinosa]|nr:Ribonuclease H-like superfamily [Sesbania bispinosa]
MDRLISPNQSAFVGGRLIQDNIIVAHEAFHALKKRTDVLSLMIRRAAESGALSASAEEVYHLQAILNSYTRASGQKINVAKSGVICGKGVASHVGTNLAAILQMQVPRKRNASWIWSSILQGRDFIKTEGRWMVATGSSINISEDNWLSSGQRLSQFRGIIQGNVQNLLLEDRRVWDVPKIRNLLPMDWCKHVLQRPISLTADSDSLVWPHSKQGDYTVKSGYKVLKQREPPSGQASTSPVPLDGLWSKVWGANVPQKRQLNMPCCSVIGPNRASPNPVSTSIKIKKLLSECYLPPDTSGAPQSSNASAQKIQSWRPPPPGFIKCNSDAAFVSSSSLAAAGSVFRDSSGFVEFGSTKKFPALSPLAAEAFALREAMLIAKNLGWKSVIFESDCLDLVRACRNEINIAEIQTFILDIRSWVLHFDRVGFTWVRRSGNGVAHSLAQYALRGDFFPASSSCWPSDIQSQLAKDRQLASSYNLHRDLGFALAASDVAHEPP